MILVLGGTTEGRIAAKVVDEADKPFYYSTRGDGQKVDTKNGIRITGGFDAGSMSDFCSEHGLRLIVDAAHPFAEVLHHTVCEVSAKLGIPVIRYERIYPERTSNVVWLDNYADAVTRMEEDGVERLLALSGVKTISKLEPYWKNHDCLFRVLDREESVEMARRQGFPEDKLLFYKDAADDKDVILGTGADAILTKESGQSGGFAEKVEAALQAGVKVYAVKRPELECLKTCTKVNGPHGLRRQIEQLLPGFYHLRTGFTTGSCATAASKAALIALLEQRNVSEVEFTLPDGETMTMPVLSCEWNYECAKASVVKDAGDDPDVTDGLVIESAVTYSREPGIHFLHGEGVGKVTLPGLGIRVGEPAINPVPRKMIISELERLCIAGLDVTISVPRGKEVALRTFNPKVGVVDGISILGTSGIVRPLSSEAYVESMSREIDVCKAVGSDVLVLNSGAKSEQTVKGVCVGLQPQSFVHYGNFIGEALRLAHEKNVAEVRLGVMIGKAVKLAEGHLDTHSHKVVMNKEFLRSLADEAGCSADVSSLISGMTLARELWQALSESDAALFFPKLLAHCMKHCRKVYPDGKLSIILVGEDGNTDYQLMTE